MHVRRKRYRPIRSVFFRSLFLVVIMMSLVVGGKALSIYADDTEVPTAATALEETSVPAVLTENSSDASSVVSEESPDTSLEDLVVPPPETDPIILPSAPTDLVDTPMKPSEDELIPSEDTPPTYVDLIPDEPKDPNDNTDEDPEVDLVDPLVETQPPAPEPEAPIVVPSSEEGEQLAESIETSDSIISLLDQATLAPEPIATRIIAEEVVIDLFAKHSCRLEKFRADVSDSSILKMRVKFLTGFPGEYVAEIGSLPAGIDVVFAANKDYAYSLKPGETTLDLEVINQIGSDDGNFSVPIIYTKIGQPDSSVICQMNILNNNEE